MHQLAKEETSFPNFHKVETWLILNPLPLIAFLSALIFVLCHRTQLLHAVTAAHAFVKLANPIDLHTANSTTPTVITPSPILQ
jgi:hypothetical protein